MRHAVDQAGDLFSISAFTATLKTRGIEASKRTIANYLGYLEDAFFVILSEKFARSQRQRTANPVKCYLFDTGFKQLAVNFSENRGKLLENLVAIELRRRGHEFFYFRDGGECDFIIAGGDPGLLGISRGQPRTRAGGGPAGLEIPRNQRPVFPHLQPPGSARKHSFHPRLAMAPAGGSKRADLTGAATSRIHL
jgi:hypothetical protein